MSYKDLKSYEQATIIYDFTVELSIDANILIILIILIMRIY